MLTKREEKNKERSKEIVQYIGECAILNTPTTKEKVIAHCVNNYGISERRAKEFIKALIISEWIKEKGGYLYEGINA